MNDFAQKRTGRRRCAAVEGAVSSLLLPGRLQGLRAVIRHPPFRPMHGRPREHCDRRAVSPLALSGCPGPGGSGGAGERGQALRPLPGKSPGYSSMRPSPAGAARGQSARHNGAAAGPARRGPQNRQPDIGRSIRQARRRGGYPLHPHRRSLGVDGQYGPYKGGNGPQKNH